MSIQRMCCLVAGFVAMAGCAKPPEYMIGTWNARVEEGARPIGVAEFAANGTFTLLIPGPISTIKGDYSIEDGKLVLDPKMNDDKISNDPNIECRLAEDKKSFSMNTGLSFVTFVKE